MFTTALAKLQSSFPKYLKKIKIYCTESMYSMFKDKLQNCSLHQIE